MAQGDRVRAGHGFLYNGNENVAIYHVDVDAEGCYIVDDEKIATPKAIGGVKPGSVGTIDGHPVKAHKRKLFGYDKVPGFGGQDTVLLFPVFFDAYQRTAWVPQDYFKVIDGHQNDLPTS